ncbi:MAG: esterase [Bacteroidetes bacterium]|nr:MAG: esterase [Bacteroidota bacterium]
MERAYEVWESKALGKSMELLVYGHSGARVLMFPTRKARFFDYENWGVIDALAPKIEAGFLQVYCVDSIDRESLYARNLAPEQMMQRHLQYEQYILDEVLPFSRRINTNMYMISAGCSLGAYHAVNIALRHPQYFGRAVGMSGRYDLTQPMGVFKDLFDGFVNDDIYFNTPNKFLANLTKPEDLARLRQLEIILAIGNDDAFLEDNKILSQILDSKAIPNKLHIWSNEAHDAVQWREMVQLYF